MAPVSSTGPQYDANGKLIKKPISWSNLAVGAGLNMFEVSTLGQPFEVLKTHMAANRGDSIVTAFSKTLQRGGVFGFYQGLIPWAWIEASTKGAILLFAASEFEYQAMANLGASAPVAGILGGMGGGIVQAFTTMGFCTFMKTVEVTRHKQAGGGAQQGTMAIARDILRREGIRGINKGVTAVAVRQCTNWGSRFGIARIMESTIAKLKQDPSKPLTPVEKFAASALSGALSTWNQPIEVIRVEMQSQVDVPGRPKKMSIGTAAKWIYENNGLKGFYRGVSPRICLGMWQSIVMIWGGDNVKAWLQNRPKS